MRAVVVGGFAVSTRQLEPVAETLCSLGLAEDADIFTLRDVFDDNTDLAQAAVGQVIVTHSAGIIPVTPHLRPNALISYNGPKPLGIGRLALRAAHKTGIHASYALTGPDREAHLLAITGNASELIKHPYANLKQLKQISQFDTRDRMQEFKRSGINYLKRIVCTRDEFYRRDLRPMNYLLRDEGHFQVIEGRHDDLLIRPEQVIRETLPVR